MLVGKLDKASDRSTDVPLEDLVRTQKPLEEWESEEGSVRPWPCPRATRLAHASHSRDLPSEGSCLWTHMVDFCLGRVHGSSCSSAPQGPTVRTRTRRKATCRPGEGVPWDSGEHLHSSPLETDHQLQLGALRALGWGPGVGEALGKASGAAGWHSSRHLAPVRGWGACSIWGQVSATAGFRGFVTLLLFSC